MAALDISSARKAFRALGVGYLFADNAGRSQCLTDVVSRISDYLLYSNVQLGADYLVSVNSTNRVASGAAAARELFNAESVDEVAYGSSSTMLVENLARALEVDIQAGEEIIITGEHECEYGREIPRHAIVPYVGYRPFPSVRPSCIVSLRTQRMLVHGSVLLRARVP